MTTHYPWSRYDGPRSYAPSATGAPLPGALLYFYQTGTSTALDTYSEDTLTTANSNPVVANQYGVFGDIFLKQQSYRVVLKDADGNEIWTADPVAPYVPPTDVFTKTVVIEVRVDNAGAALGTGICADCYVPFACTLSSAVLQADQAGDVVVDVWAAPFVVDTPPTSGDSITASAPPTLATSQSSINTTLVGWDNAIAAGTAMRFNIVSVGTILRFTLSLVAEINLVTTPIFAPAP